MMEGFGVNTYRLVTAEGRTSLVKFHWKPVLGTHSLIWDEAQKIAGKDPDFLRHDLYEAIDTGAYPEWELGVQVVPEDDELRYGFDLLDCTKLLPEEEVPVRLLGRMVLNRPPDNFFSEVEQVAFCPANIVPGIDFSDDPILQGRLFSYLDTQLSRLGGPNFPQIPINRPIVGVHNNQRAGFHHRETIDMGRTSYYPNSLGGGCPVLATSATGGFVPRRERLDGETVRARGDSFREHFSQARLFWHSLTRAEQDHLVLAAHFELGKVAPAHIRERMVALFANVDSDLAARVAAGIGVAAPETGEPSAAAPAEVTLSPSLSLAARPGVGIATRKVAVLAFSGFVNEHLQRVAAPLQQRGALPEVVSGARGPMLSDGGVSYEVLKTFLTSGSVLFDAVFVPGNAGGASAVTCPADAVHFVQEAFQHGKPVAAIGSGVELLRRAALPVRLADTSTAVVVDHGVITSVDRTYDEFVAALVTAIEAGRDWSRAPGSLPV